MPQSFDLRSAAKSDFEFCWPIYRDTMRPLFEPPTDWRENDHVRTVEKALAHDGSSIIRSEGSDAGWLHVTENGQVIGVKQFLVVPALRNKGIGTGFLEWMKERADRKRKDLTVELMAASRARALLERMGFKAVPGTGRMVTMRY